MAADPVALAPDPKVAQHIDDFLAAQLSPRTRETYAVDLALFLNWLRGRGRHPCRAARWNAPWWSDARRSSRVTPLAQRVPRD